MKKKIVITGPESTGKTTLAKYLANKFNDIWLPEFARQYVEQLNRKYTYEDIVLIAQRQIEKEKKYLKKTNKILFVDTSLIITKVWFETVFKKFPYWLEPEILKNKADFYLLTYPDIEWKYDPVRENPGNKRFILYEKYLQNLKKYNFKYDIIKGYGQKRYDLAEKLIRNILK